MDSMYEILMDLPLFKGVSYTKISEVIETTKFHFLKYTPGETIVTAGETCTHVKFIISGSARMIISNSTSRFKVSQTLNAPEVIAPSYLFGPNTHYPGTVTAIEPTGILQFSKNDYMKILNSDPIFLYNFLNILSMSAQKSVDGVLALTTGSLEERIALWIVALTQRDATDIVLSCRTRDLYSLFGVQRSSFISTLEDLKARGLIDFTPNDITFTSRRGMVDLLMGANEE